MELTVSHTQARVPITIFQVTGLINLGSTAILEQNAQQEYQDGMRYLLLDLAEVESLTSAGLRTILLIQKMLASSPPSEDLSAETASQAASKEPSPYLKLLNPQADIRRVLSISGFDRYFEIFSDQQNALNSF
jgi:anti-anti-sigma regulatory factor